MYLKVLQTYPYRFQVKEIVIFLSRIVNTDVDIFVMWICKQRTIENTAYVFTSNIPFLDTCK